MPEQAVLYLRSSKDRHDVSINVQRRLLHDLAVARGLTVVGEFVDVVESGKDEGRLGFQEMYQALRAPGRTWKWILVLDTSRIARRRLISMMFETECERRRGVRVVYRSIPESDAPTEMLLRAQMQAFDEYLSLVSRVKGLAGMAENVRQGWRAGGRAPRGYRLDYHPTGAIREGSPVMKSRLVPSDEAPVVAAYLKARAAGAMRGPVLARLGVDWPKASLNGMEHSALTYAGHTVWNVHAEREMGASATGTRRRPRSEWVIRRDTHEPLITSDEAETILARLERQRQRNPRQDAHPYLLAGLLTAPDGQTWSGDQRRFYRLGRTRRVQCRHVDAAVRDTLFAGLESDESVEILMTTMRNVAGQSVDGRSIAALRRRAKTLEAQIARTVDVAATMADPAPVLRRVTDLETERARLLQQAADLENARAEAENATVVTADDVRRALTAMREALATATASESFREALVEMVDRVEMDPATLSFRILMRQPPAAAGGIMMASRRKPDLSPPWVLTGQLPRRRAA